MTEDVKKLIAYPVKFQIGKIFDANGDHILDIRGWGRLQYMPTPETKQDAIGEWIAEAINEKLQR